MISNVVLNLTQIICTSNKDAYNKFHIRITKLPFFICESNNNYKH